MTVDQQAVEAAKGCVSVMGFDKALTLLNSATVIGQTDLGHTMISQVVVDGKIAFIGIGTEETCWVISN